MVGSDKQAKQKNANSCPSSCSAATQHEQRGFDGGSSWVRVRVGVGVGGGLKRGLEFGTHSLGIPRAPLSLKAPNSSRPRPFILPSATRKDPAHSSVRPHLLSFFFFFTLAFSSDAFCMLSTAAAETSKTSKILRLRKITSICRHGMTGGISLIHLDSNK